MERSGVFNSGISTECHNQAVTMPPSRKVKKEQRVGNTSQGTEIQPDFIKKNTFLMRSFKRSPSLRAGEP